MYPPLRLGPGHCRGVPADAIAEYYVGEGVLEGGRGVEPVSAAVALKHGGI